MYRKLIYLVSVVLVLSLPSTTYGIVISNFENSMDGWNTSDPNTVTEYSNTAGVTLGNYSLRLSAPGDYINALQFNLSGQVRNDFLSRKLLTVDVTRLASEWTASGEYCQLLLAVNGGGSGWSVWQVLDETADWSPDQGDQTITLTFDYSSTLGDINLSSIWWFELFLITNYDPNYYDPNYTAGGVYYLDNIQLIGDEKAVIPNPADGARNVRIEPTLSWVPGDYVDTHDVYFGTSFNSVKNANKSNLPSDIIYINIDVNSYKPATLEFNTTYYWRVDEVNNAHPDKLWKGTVWSFTTGNYIAVDDFEDYNDFSPYKIFQTWLDGVGYSADEILPGYGGNETGSAVGSNAKPWAEQLIVHSGFQSMPFKYINDGSTGKAFYSEIFRQWDDPQDWTTEEGKALSLWFRGYPATVGSYSYNAATDTFTVKADGADIWGNADDFHFVYKELTGDADIIAKVVSCENTNEWAKAGVMIRDSLDEDSTHALMCVTPSGRRAFQNRPVYKDTSLTAHSDVNQITTPIWVKLERESGIPNDVITAYYSTSPTLPAENDWIRQPEDEYTGDDASRNPAGVVMTDPVYVGLAYTSHEADIFGEAVFSDVSINGAVSGNWQSQDVPKNDAEQLYLVIEDADEVSTVVKHPDPNAVLFDTFQEWTIYLQDINDAGVDLKNIKRMYIGVGDRDNPVSGGTGKLYIDDIRLYRSGCMFSKRSADFAKADYAPTGDPAGDCVIDYQELEIMARDWLIKDDILEVGASGFIAYYPLDEGTGNIATDTSGNGNDGTLVGNPQWVAGQIDGALQFDGTDDCVNLGNKPAFNPSGSFSISLWANITNWSTNWNHAMIGNRGEDGVGWQLRRHSNDNFCFTTRGISRDDTASETIPSLNEWIHIACVYDNINNTKSIYLNGVQDKVVTTNPGSIRTTTHNTYIGARANSANTGQEAFFSGMLDDVRIYNRPLLPGEVEFLADPTPGDGQLYIPVSSPAELYESEDRGSRAINLKDFAVLVDMWLVQQVWP